MVCVFNVITIDVVGKYRHGFVLLQIDHDFNTNISTRDIILIRVSLLQRSHRQSGQEGKVIKAPK